MNGKILVVSGLLLALLLGGCARADEATGTPVSVAFDELVANPQTYRGRSICTAGVYASGFEVNALGASTYRDGDAVYLIEPAVWIEGTGVLSRSDCFNNTPAIGKGYNYGRRGRRR